MKKPTLEEVKDYFKDAKEVKCVNFKNIKELINGVYKEDSTGFLYEFSNDYIRLYSHKNGYSEIITYKNKNIMKSDLSKVKVGDSIWTIQEGWTKVKNIFDGCLPIRTKYNSYNLDGTYYTKDQHPSAFLTNPFVDKVRTVLVSDNNIDWVERDGVIVDGKFCILSGWDYCKEIENPKVTKLTYQEIADKFNVDVNTLKIKK